MAEITQLFIRDDDFRNQAADLIKISRTLPPNLKAAFADKTEHFSEYEFGYYADLSSAKSVGEFKNKIHTFEYCARRSGNLEIVQRVKNMNDRLNHTRVCESQMEKAPVVPLLAITRQGVDGNYKDLRNLFDDQYNRSLMLLPHVMRQRVLPVIVVVEETLVKTLDRISGSEPIRALK
jgi:hypothetical protein